MYTYTNEPAHDKTYNKTCDQQMLRSACTSTQPMAMVLIYLFLNSMEAVKGTCDQRRL